MSSRKQQGAPPARRNASTAGTTARLLNLGERTSERLRAVGINIAVDPPERSRALAEKLGLTYPLLSDTDLAVTRAFGLEDAENGVSWPALYVIAPDGTVRWRSLSETYKERAAPDLILQALSSSDSPAKP